jgi:adenylyltransferase/sulfurtransferase
MRDWTVVVLVAVALVVASCASAGTPAPGAYVDVSPQEAKELIDNNPDLIVIDVSPAYAQGHLPRAVNYYLGDGSLDEAIPSLDKNGKYLVYCHVDSVAIAGAQKLVDAGFKNVYRLEGNYAAWVAAGYEIEK